MEAISEVEPPCSVAPAGAVQVRLPTVQLRVRPLQGLGALATGVPTQLGMGVLGAHCCPGGQLKPGCT